MSIHDPYFKWKTGITSHDLEVLNIYGKNDIAITTSEASKNCINVIYGCSNMLLLPGIVKVIFNDPATIVFWKDGSKTVTKCGEMDIYDPEKGLAMCFAKRLLGNEGNYYNVFKQWLPREEDEDSLFNRVDFTANICPDSYKSLITGMKDAVNKLTFSVDLSPDNSHPYPENKKGDNDNG